ncbi:SDR family NAD(P)-dependent oxidoreductase [Reyranella sp. CPCC 100927]|uniref:SDR family NAD(P)-dependent oxidoreductase n=1 Tax=Reyranella sp. CPCC 100927 TaxID=2599616 RepID=UPI0011B5F564|nr:SDR family NAD(P)-dependent oxidoreductase [Reyranella sp. CPCC 100927]TWT11598.1 SDR family oxidoreductase [Reyranella sp. CPCC 100927]
MEISLAGKTAMVTGAGGGLGRAITLSLAACGASVWACDIDGKTAAATAQTAGTRCHSQALDVTDRAAVLAAVAEIGTVDILVNNAGGGLGYTHRPIESVSPQEWAAVFDVNSTGALHCTQAVTPGMKAAGGGRIVNISSDAGIRTARNRLVAYGAAKAAVISLTRHLAEELGPWGITVNSVAPGFINVSARTQRQWLAYGEEGQKALLESIHLRRLGSADDVARAVLFFASDLAGWVTGQVLSVNGGRS